MDNNGKQGPCAHVLGKAGQDAARSHFRHAERHVALIHHLALHKVLNVCQSQTWTVEQWVQAILEVAGSDAGQTQIVDQTARQTQLV